MENLPIGSLDGQPRVHRHLGRLHREGDAGAGLQRELGGGLHGDVRVQRAGMHPDQVGQRLELGDGDVEGVARAALDVVAVDRDGRGPERRDRGLALRGRRAHDLAVHHEIGRGDRARAPHAGDQVEPGQPGGELRPRPGQHLRGRALLDHPPVRRARRPGRRAGARRAGRGSPRPRSGRPAPGAASAAARAARRRRARPSARRAAAATARRRGRARRRPAAPARRTARPAGGPRARPRRPPPATAARRPAPSRAAYRRSAGRRRRSPARSGAGRAAAPARAAPYGGRAAAPARPRRCR